MHGEIYYLIPLSELEDFSKLTFVILTTDLGLSLRGVVIIKPAGHVVRARSS